MKLAGIDLAWHGEFKPSAVVTGDLVGNELRIDLIEPAIVGLEPIFTFLKAVDSLKGIAIDAPLIIQNKKGQRSCEKNLSKMYGSRGASCHASNLKLYPNALSVSLSKMLVAEGYHHLGTNKWQIECYPHPSIIEFFGLKKRLKYKKGKVAEKKKGQINLATYLLSKSSTMQLVVPDQLQHYFKADYINTLKGKSLKSNEDVLDAVVCLCIAASYSSQTAHVQFGNSQKGYIWVPMERRI